MKEVVLEEIKGDMKRTVKFHSPDHIVVREYEWSRSMKDWWGPQAFSISLSDCRKTIKAFGGEYE